MVHAIITGGSSGIGLAMARLFVGRGDNVTLMARGLKRLDQAKEELISLRLSKEQKVLCISVDVCEEDNVHKAIDQAIDELGIPEYVVMSAGVVDPGYFSDLDLSQFRNNMDVNYFGSLHVVQAVLPTLKKAKSGRLVFISSGAGLIGLWGYAAYSPSKFAIRGLAEVLRGELKADNIQVSIAFPADTDTPQFQEELPIRPRETSIIAGKAKIWSASDMARAILTKVDTRRFVIAPGLEMGALARFHSLVGPILNFWFDYIVKEKCR